MMHHDSRDTGHEVLLKMLGVNCLKPLLLFSFQYMSNPTCGQMIHFMLSFLLTEVYSVMKFRKLDD